MSHVAFVTGASGFVGSHLARQLHQQGWIVHVLARASSDLTSLSDIPLQRHEGDVSDSDSIRAAMPPEAQAVFHVAASTNFWSKKNEEQTRTNVDGTRNMLEAASTTGAGRFIHTSSFVTWGFRQGHIDETSVRSDETDWINYVRTKTEAERLVLEASESGQIDGVILNPAHIMGPGDRHNWSTMFRMLNQGKLPGAPPGGGNICDVREVARAHLQAFHHGRNGQRYLLGGHPANFVDLMQIAGRLLDRKAPHSPMPAWAIKTWARTVSLLASLTGKEPDVTPEAAAMVCYRMECDSSLARDELDYRFNDIEAIIRDTLDWMKKEELL